MKKNTTFIMALIFSLFSIPLCYGDSPIRLWADPEAIFLKQSVSLRFTLKVGNGTEKPVVSLMKLSEGSEGEKVSEMHDDGKNGDKKANDGNFTAVIKLVPQKVEYLRFKSFINFPKSSTKQVSGEVKVEVIECPQ